MKIHLTLPESHMNSSQEKTQYVVSIFFRNVSIQCFQVSEIQMINIVLSVSATPQNFWSLVLTQLSCSSHHFGETTFRVSVLGGGTPHLSGPEQHGGPGFNVDVPQWQDLDPPHRMSKMHFVHQFCRSAVCEWGEKKVEVHVSTNMFFLKKKKQTKIFWNKKRFRWLLAPGD